MLSHLETKHNVQFGRSPSDRCDYFATYQQDTVTIAVVGGIHNPPRCNALALKDYNSGVTVILQDGYMIDLNWFNCDGRLRGDLTLRHDRICFEDLSRTLRLWHQDHFYVFDRDPYIRRHPTKFKELLEAEEEELAHGLTYKVLSLSNGDLSVADLAKAIVVEENPRFRRDLIEYTETYVYGVKENPASIGERILAVRLLECLGETEAAERAKAILFRREGEEIKKLYEKTARMKRPTLERYQRNFAPTPFIRDF